MGKIHIVIFLLLLVLPSLLLGQCIDRKTLRDRIVYLKDSSGVNAAHQLKELLHYQSVSARCNYRNDSSGVLLLQRISRLYAEDGQYSQALHYTLQAIEMVASNIANLAINPAHQIRNYYNLAGIYDVLNVTSEKIKAYDSCFTVARRLNIVNLYVIASLREKVRYQNNIGDYNLCISLADLGETLSRRYIPERNMEAYGDSTTYALDFVIEKANALLVLQKNTLAENFLLARVALCNSRTSVKYLGYLYELLATATMQQKRYAESLKYYNVALKNYKNNRDTLAYKDDLHNIGYLYDNIYKDYDKALYYYRSATKIKVLNPDRARQDSIHSLNIYSNIGNVYAHKGWYDSAKNNFRQAFNLIKNGANETELLQSSLDDFIRNQKVEYLTSLFINKGDALYTQYLATGNDSCIQQAIRMYYLTDRLLERIKSNQLEIQSKLFWRKITHPFYERAIEACVRVGKSKEAFYFFERSRAILLYDQMKEQRGGSENDILHQQRLKNQVREAQQQLHNTNSDSPDFKRLQIAITAYNDSLQVLLGKIKTASPLYFSNFLDSSFISLEETRRNLLKDHNLIEIFNGDSCVYSMVVTSKEISFSRIDKTVYDNLIQECLSYMSNHTLTNSRNLFDAFAKKSNQLYRLLFKDKVLPEGPVIFSVDGHHFPFETLVIDPRADGPVYFLEKHAVSYTYSARYLMSQFSRSPSLLTRDFLGVAPVLFPSKNHLSSLPGSDDAIRNLAPLFTSSDTLINNTATRKAFLTKFGSYQVVQLFSHSADSSSKGEPVIYFADEPMYLSELNHINSPATKLMVLSACETGDGEFYEGEGVFSFNRAFAALGIPACINNLWSVDNESTYELTNLFYKNISKGLPTDSALQLAKLEFIKKSSGKKQMPYFWASTILAGKSEVIEFSKRQQYLTIVLVVSGLIFFSLFVIIGITKFRKLDHGVA